MKIFVYDEFAPQDNAMLQALYSRSAKSVEEHVKKVRETGSGNFMEKFYVGYGHHSIADCGSTTIFIEGISMLADKAIQDWPLYSGQETSTRYIDMSKQPIIDPIENEESKAIIKDWMDFYVNNQEKVREYLKKKYPRKEGEDKKVYEKAISARSFDIMRGFLPAGITTQLSWHTNLRQGSDKLAILNNHPLEEVRKISEEMLGQLKDKYSHSFSHEWEEEQEKYRKMFVEEHTYFETEKSKKFEMETSIEEKELSKYEKILKKRPEKTGLPLFLFELGLVHFKFILDFGSFRDIQRHRNGVCRMPLLTTKRGFNKWYLKQLPEDLQKEADELIKKQIEKIDNLVCSKEEKQYFIAMGFNVDCQVSYGLPATVYTVELRSGRYVHPTLRKVAHQMAKSLQKKFPKLKLNCDWEMDDWDVRRGLQDITEKE